MSGYLLGGLLIAFGVLLAVGLWWSWRRFRADVAAEYRPVRAGEGLWKSRQVKAVGRRG